MKTPADIEALVQWALSQSGKLPWRGVTPRELMFDFGYDAWPEKTPKVFHGAGGVLRCSLDHDAQLVLDVLMDLPDPGIAGVVIACARAGIRPDWMANVEPRLVPLHKRCKKKHRKVVVGHRWEPCSPEAICQARAIYGRWHGALRVIMNMVSANLNHWEISGFRAPHEPWATAAQQAA